MEYFSFHVFVWACAVGTAACGARLSHACYGGNARIGKNGIIRKVVKGNLFEGNNPPVQSQAREMGCAVGQFV